MAVDPVVGGAGTLGPGAERGPSTFSQVAAATFRVTIALLDGPTYVGWVRGARRGPVQPVGQTGPRAGSRRVRHGRLHGAIKGRPVQPTPRPGPQLVRARLVLGEQAVHAPVLTRV